MKELEPEVRELRRANDILRKASAYLARPELDRRPNLMVEFIDEHREEHGGQPICEVLPIARSTCSASKAQEIDATRRSSRSLRDAVRRVEIKRAWNERFGVYGARKDELVALYGSTRR